MWLHATSSTFYKKNRKEQINDFMVKFLCLGIRNILRSNVPKTRGVTHMRGTLLQEVSYLQSPISGPRLGMRLKIICKCYLFVIYEFHFFSSTLTSVLFCTFGNTGKKIDASPNLNEVHQSTNQSINSMKDEILVIPWKIPTLIITQKSSLTFSTASSTDCNVCKRFRCNISVNAMWIGSIFPEYWSNHCLSGLGA